MTWTRRRFVATAIGAAASAGLVRSAWARAFRVPGGETYFDWKRVAEGVLAAFGEGGNSLVVVGDSASLLVDCKNAPFGRVLRRESDALGSKLSLVVNTHHHADHTGGNEAFTPDLLVFAHELARERILNQTKRYVEQIRSGVAAASRSKSPAATKVVEEARALAERADTIRPEAFLPARSIGEHEELEVGGVTVALHHFGPGHTDNDVVVHLPKANVIHCGDLLFHRLYPYWDGQGGVSGEGWIRSLGAVLDLCDDRTVVVPGHGELTDRAGVQAGIDVHRRIRDAAGQAVKAGTSREAFIAAEIPELSGLGFPMAKPLALGGWYDEVSRSGG